MNEAFEALAHPARRAILEQLKQGARTAGELAESLAIPRPTMSSHFAKLKSAGLIHGEQRGTTIFYSINLSALQEVLLGFMNRFAGKTERGEQT